MTYTPKSSKIKTIKQDNPAFLIRDGIFVAPRAGFEIDQMCPENYRFIITECISKGWLKPIAHLTEKELTFLGLVA